MELNGIDVSNWQGPSFPWQDYKGKIQFAGVKISEGLDEDLGAADPDAKINIAGARSIGAVVIGYHLLHASLGGALQARFFLAAAAAAGLRPGDLIAVDAEDAGLDGLDATKMDLVAAGFCGWCHDHAGAWPVCYTEQSMAPALVHEADCPPWIANPSQVQLSFPLGPWRSVSFEQRGQRGVDTDTFYGSAEQLEALAIPKGM